jgi:hypothetical protein
MRHNLGDGSLKVGVNISYLSGCQFLMPNAEATSLRQATNKVVGNSKN